jgi:hypothetical protein
MGKSRKKARSDALYGYCNICNKYDKLTRDHVPPKGSITLNPVQMKSLTQWMAEMAPGRVNMHGGTELLAKDWHPRLSQGGVSFRSICADCNNLRLGRRYDPELNRVSLAMGTLNADCTGDRFNASRGTTQPKSSLRN